MRITIKQYAQFKKVSEQAVTYWLRKNSERNVPLHTNLQGVTKVYKLGRSYELEFNGYLDKSNPKKPQLRENTSLPYDNEKTRQII